MMSTFNHLDKHRYDSQENDGEGKCCKVSILILFSHR